MIRVLLTGGGGSGNEALYRMLQRRYDLHFADADVDAIAPVIERDRAHVIPLAHDPAFGEVLGSLCRALHIDLVIPGVDEELPKIPMALRALPGVLALMPDESYVMRMMDKLTCASLLREKGIKAPATYTMADISELSFPCVAKPRWGRGSRDFRVLADADQAGAYVKLTGLPPSEIVVQEHLVGQEYTVMMAADREARLGAVVPVRVVVKRGITIRGVTENHPTVIDACRAIHDALPTSGCYNIQLMLSTDGRVAPFEINPRVSTTLCLAVAAGVDPIALYLDGVSSDAPVPFKAGLMLHRHWYNAFE